MIYFVEEMFSSITKLFRYQKMAGDTKYNDE